MKAYIASSTSAATANNNQRKLMSNTIGSTTVHHLVYESGGDVWYSTSTNGGTWTPEVLVSDGSGNNRNPSIDVFNVGTSNIYAQVVWVNISNNTVFFRQRHSYLGNWTWLNSEAIPVTEPTPGYNPASWTPVVSRNYVAYNRYHSGGSAGQIVIRNRWNPNSWYNAGPVPGTNASSTNPTIIVQSTGVCHIAYENTSNQSIHYATVVHQGAGSYGWTSTEQVSPVGWQYNANPSITLISVSNTTPAVSWQSRNNVVSGGSSVHNRQRVSVSGGVWQNPVHSYSYTSQIDLRPTLGSLIDQNHMAIMWSNNGTVTRGNYNGTTMVWSSPIVVASGANGGDAPNVTQVANATVNSKGVWRKTSWPLSFAPSGAGSGGPFPPTLNPIGFVQMSSSGTAAEEETPLPYVWTRHALVDVASALEDVEVSGSKTTTPPSGTLGFALQRIAIGNNQVSFSSPNALGEAQGPATYSTKAFTVTNEPVTISGTVYGKSLTLPESYKEQIPALAQVLIRDAESNAVLRVASEIATSELTESISNDFGSPKATQIDLQGLEGKEVHVEVVMLGQSSGVSPVIIDNYLIEGTESQQVVHETALELEKTENVPSEFKLDQNFPNPFNPETKISYQLNEPGQVKLEIYDILGSRVTILADGQKPAGYHSATWRITDGSSGTFIYRLTFIGPTGQAKTVSRKMVVAK